MRTFIKRFSNQVRLSALSIAFLTVFDLNSKQYKPPKDEKMNRVDCCALPGIFAMPAINILACELLQTHVPGIELPNRRAA